MSQKESLTIGILAHVDAGKTSLTEGLLFKAGATSTQGSVDKGSAITDGLSIEKNRGISIKTATVDFEWKDTHIHLVDTPGHIDFSAEVDRALSILDLVILVVSAKEGVQAHTLNLWERLKERKLPVLVFINKVDRAGVDMEQVFMDFQKDLSTKLFALNYADISQANAPVLCDFKDAEPYFSSPVFEQSFENLAEYDEDFLERYLEGDIADLDNILVKAGQQFEKRNVVPCVFGSAKLDLGIDLVLDTIVNYFTAAPPYFDSVSAKVFKVEFDAKLGRLAHIRSYGSTLQTKDVVLSQMLEKTFKVNQIYKLNLGKREQVSELLGGEIGVISTSELVRVGDVIGSEKWDDDFEALSQSVLSVQVLAEDEKDYQKLGEALEILNVEDPQLDFVWYKDEREFHIKILGPIQTEVLKDTLETRFRIAALFLTPKVIYKETPNKVAEGFVRYWMPKPCWAIMTFLVEPGDPGSGVSFSSKVRSDDISVKYQNEIKRALPWALRQGIKGWEVTDIKVTLQKGSEHTVHSNPGDFLLATPMGVLRGLEAADTDLLEPMYRYEIKAHQDHLGSISSDLNQMKAQLDAPEFQDEYFTLTGRVSVAKAMNYSIAFNATTSGKGRLKLSLDGYEKTLVSDDKISTFKGVSPLDEAQWVLHKRGAFKADER